MERSISGFDIEAVEKKYNATFIGDFPIKLKGGNWGNASAVFYQPNPDLSKGYKHLFGLYLGEPPVIFDASYLDGHEFVGVKLADGSYVWSRHVHDFRDVPGGFIDGGFDYYRVGGDPKVVNLKIEKDKVVEC
jgi:hypothetical protein